MPAAQEWQHAEVAGGTRVPQVPASAEGPASGMGVQTPDGKSQRVPLAQSPHPASAVQLPERGKHTWTCWPRESLASTQSSLVVQPLGAVQGTAQKLSALY